MPISIVQLGTARVRGEGLRIGTVRRPPRGVKKEAWARENWYDVWLPNLAPSAALMSETSVLTDKTAWPKFSRRYAAELKQPEQSHLLDMLAAMSHQTSFSIGCYCADEAHCHRSILRKALKDRGAVITA